MQASQVQPPPEVEARETLRDASERLLAGLGALDLDDLRGSRAQVDRARSILRDAITRLNGSFEQLAHDTDEQRKQVSGLISDMSGELAGKDEENSINVQWFVSQTSTLLGSFADLVTHFSKQSVGIAYKIDDMTDQMKAIFRLIEQVDAIAEDTNILAINAALEAVRAGDKGKGFGVVASEVRVLSRKTKVLNDSIVEHMKDAERSILSVRDAVGLMASHDMTMALSAKADVDTMMEKLDGMQQNVEFTLGQMEMFTSRVEESAAEAIRSLQFEDLVTQVLQNVDERFARVESAFLSIRAAAEDDGVSADARLRGVRAAIDEYETACHEAKQPAVEQTTMDEGEVTFF